jgi:hypothetical protein
MKFFLVISIVAFWWVPLNSPGNIGIEKFPLITDLSQGKTDAFNTLVGNSSFITKRKMDHFGYQIRRQLLKNKID